MARKMTVSGVHALYVTSCTGCKEGGGVGEIIPLFRNTYEAKKAGWKCLRADLWLCPSCYNKWEDMKGG